MTKALALSRKTPKVRALERVDKQLEKEQEIIRLAGLIANQAMLDKILEDTAPALRAGVFAKLRPHLPFEPFVQEAPIADTIADCPTCGLRRGSVIEHECLVQ